MKFFRTLLALHDNIFLFLAAITLILAGITSNWNFFRLDIAFWNTLLFEILIINFTVWVHFFCNLYCHILWFWSINHNVVHHIISVGVILENIIVYIIWVRKYIWGHRRYRIVHSVLRKILVILIEEIVSIKARLSFLIGIGNFWNYVSHKIRYFLHSSLSFLEVF